MIKCNLKIQYHEDYTFNFHSKKILYISNIYNFFLNIQNLIYEIIYNNKSVKLRKFKN